MQRCVKIEIKTDFTCILKLGLSKAQVHTSLQIQSEGTDIYFQYLLYVLSCQFFTTGHLPPMLTLNAN